MSDTPAFNTLSNEQRTIVEQNHNLIYSYLHSRNLEIDRWYDIAAIGLCKAAMTYDRENNASFSTYAFSCMNNEVRNELRIAKRCVKPVVDLEDIEVDNIDCLDILADPEDCFASVFLKDAVKNAKRGLSERDIKVIDLITYRGYKQREVADELNMNRANVSLIYKKFVKRVKEYFES